MHPNLVGSSCFQTKAQLGELLKALDHPEMSHCLPGRGRPGQHRHFLPVRGVAAQRLVHRTRFHLERAIHHGAVFPGKGVSLNLFRQAGVGEVVFRHHQQAAGILVNAVDNPRPGHPVDPGKGIPAVIQQGVDQGPVFMAGRRVHHHPFGLVHHQQVPVLVHNIQGDILRKHFQRANLRQLHLNQLSGLQFGAFGQHFPAAGDAPALDQVLDCGAGHVLQRGGEKLVHPLASLLHRQGELTAHCWSSTWEASSSPPLV